MTLKSIAKRIVPFVFIAALCAVDQLIKMLAQIYLSDIATFPIIDGVLHFTYTENRGAAFSSMQGQTWILVYLTGAVLIALSAALAMGKFKTRLSLVSVTMVIAGGFGNLIDRIFRGAVIDFVDFRLIGFAIFNFADCLVVIGVIMFFISFILSERDKNKEAGETENDSKD